MRGASVVEPALWQAVKERGLERVRSHKFDAVTPDSYYLRGQAFCGHGSVRLSPASRHGNSGRINSYECTRNTKGKSACPVKRVNATSLHEAAREHIQRGVEHPWHMAELIRAGDQDAALAADGTSDDGAGAAAWRPRRIKRGGCRCWRSGWN
jgi:hypothetical protein